MSHSSARNVSMSGCQSVESLFGSSTMMSMSEHGCSSPRPYPPTATSARSPAMLADVRDPGRRQRDIDEARPVADQILRRPRRRRSARAATRCRGRAPRGRPGGELIRSEGSRAATPRYGQSSGARAVAGALKRPPLGALRGGSGAERQHLEAALGDQNRVFPLRRQRLVLRDHGPAVRRARARRGAPALIIGSIVNIMPGSSSRPVPGWP